MAFAAPVMLWVVMASASNTLVSDGVPAEATHCGWKVGTATTRVDLPVVLVDGKRRCGYDISTLAPVAPANTKTTRLDTTMLAISGGSRLNESTASEHRYVRVTKTATSTRYDIIQSITCNAAGTCFPF
jgi:hypothetical protein